MAKGSGGGGGGRRMASNVGAELSNMIGTMRSVSNQVLASGTRPATSIRRGGYAATRDGLLWRSLGGGRFEGVGPSGGGNGNIATFGSSTGVYRVTSRQLRRYQDA